MLKPLNSKTRELVSLDGMWAFALDDGKITDPWRGSLPKGLEVPVPASYNDLFLDSQIRDHVGWVWYQRDVHVPRGWGNDRVFVRLDAATHHGLVYVGEHLVADHEGGYLPFEADITDLVEAGSTFRLTVGVDNRLTNTTIPPGEITKMEVTLPGQLTIVKENREVQTVFHDFYNYAGLARSVWLYSAPASRIEDVTVTTDLNGADGVVNYTVRTTEPSEVVVCLRDEDGAVVAEGQGAQGQLIVADASLWQPGAAYLYEFEVQLRDGERLVDDYRLQVGIRTVEVRGTEFLINNKPFYFTGFGKHEDTPIRGKGHDPAYLVHDFELMKWMGANSFRTSHYPYAEEVLDYADRHGIVVIDETAAVGLNLGLGVGLGGRRTDPSFSETFANDQTRAAHAQHLRDLIARDKNHPSVVMWSIANEPASHEEGSRPYFEPLTTLARELDHTRPITFSQSGYSCEGDKIVDLFDVISLNRYWGWYILTGDLKTGEKILENELRGWAAKYGKPIIMSEYGADTVAGVHSVQGAPWSEEFQVDFLDMHHRVFDRIPEFIGEHVWNFADFATGYAVLRVDGNKKGVFTRDRKPKAAVKTLRGRWADLNGSKPIAP